MFGYEITLFDQVDNVAYSTMDPLESRCAIPAEMRPLVVDITLFCYQKLLEHCDPEYIFRKTWLSEPCENGLKKHVKATEALTQSGYVVVKDGTDQYGCKFWLLGKSDSDHSGLELAEATDQLGVEQ
jgi:hypothetical protein